MPPTPENPLPGVPLVESPFFVRFFNEHTCDAETLRIARDLHTQGFAIIDFPDREIHARAQRIQASLRARYDWDGWRAGRKDSLRIQNASEFDADVKSIATNAAVLDLLSQLYGRRAFPFQTLSFPVGTQQALHSDSFHFSSHPERFMCGVWVPLEDIDLDNGPLVYAPGSHAWPIYTNEHAGVNTALLFEPTGQYPHFEHLWATLVRERGVELRRFCARRGQALIWAANLLHGGDRQHDLARTRWSQVTHYYFDGCSYYTPLRSDPFYGRIHFRETHDLTTGQAAVHEVGGLPVPPEFIEQVRPRPVDPRDPAIKRRLGLPDDFDHEAYLALNPDVQASGVDPRRHYLEFGRREGRSYRAPEPPPPPAAAPSTSG